MLDPVIHDDETALVARRALEYYIIFLHEERRDTFERQYEIDIVDRILKDIERRLHK